MQSMRLSLLFSDGQWYTFNTARFDLAAALTDARVEGLTLVRAYRYA